MNTKVVVTECQTNVTPHDAWKDISSPQEAWKWSYELVNKSVQLQSMVKHVSWPEFNWTDLWCCGKQRRNQPLPPKRQWKELFTNTGRISLVSNMPKRTQSLIMNKSKDTKMLTSAQKLNHMCESFKVCNIFLFIFSVLHKF